MSITLAALITIGVIDSGLKPNTDQVANLSITVIDEGKSAPEARTSLNSTHGQATLKAIARETNGQPIRVLYASPFAPSPKGGNYMRVDWDRAIHNLEQMHNQGVTLVCTTFVTNERDEATRFMEAANRLNIKVVASLGNGETDTPYPALHPDAIAVYRRDGSNPAFVKRADYLENPRGERKGGNVVMGSSFAAARVCGKLAGEAQ